MGTSLFYPAFLDVNGARCLVVGGGAVATRKTRRLLDAGAVVTVVSPETSEALDAMSSGERAIEIRCKAFESSELEGVFLVVAAAGDPAVNEAVAREARARGILVNVVDQPALSTFIVPATVSRGKLQVAVSTGGASPAFAKRLRERLEGLLNPRLASYLEDMAEVRALVLEQVSDMRKRAEIFEALASDELVAAYLEADGDAAGSMLLARASELIAQAGAGE